MSVEALLKCVQHIRLVKTRLEALCVCAKKASSLAPWITQSHAEVRELLVRPFCAVMFSMNNRMAEKKTRGCAYTGCAEVHKLSKSRQYAEPLYHVPQRYSTSTPALPSSRALLPARMLASAEDGRVSLAEDTNSGSDSMDIYWAPSM